MDNQKVKKFTIENGCPFCGHMIAKRLGSMDRSDIMCQKCGALFYGLDHFDLELQGVFLGKYEIPPRESMFIKK